MVGGTKLWCSALMEKIASIAAAAPRRCPVIDLVELMESCFAAFSPNAIFIAMISFRSPIGVEVPCALI